jgi:DNA-binding response OmpR family regulator
LSIKNQPKILVVDDQPINVKLLQRKLERQGMEITVAFNGKECIAKVHESQPDLILLDVMMPEMDGIETCHRLKANPITEHIPIIFITAKTSREGKVEGLDAGAVDYITKPIDLDETLARVRTQLRLQEMHKENISLQERLAESRKTAAIGAITKGLAHNLNNLLGVTVGYLDLIKHSHDNADLVKRSIKLMDNATIRMVEIVSQLGSIATQDNIQMATTPIHRLIETSIDRFLQESGVDPATVETMLMFDDKEKMSANNEIFENTLISLLKNARESYLTGTAPELRMISVQASITENENAPALIIKISDQGAGIAKEIENVVFEPFTTTKTSVGRGMGLTIARHAVRNLDGDVTLKPNPEGGVTATLIHPL